MKTKGTKKTTKTTAKKQRSAINYVRFAQLWEQGKSYEEIGKAMGIRGKEENDPYKPVRAIASNMLNGRATAWKDANGKVRTLQPRVGMRAIGKGKKAPKAKAEKKVVALKSDKKTAVKAKVA
jgi:hypothetical protein